MALTLDNNVTTSVSPKPSSFTTMSEINKVNDIADILDEGLHHIQRINKWEDFKDDIAHKFDILGIAIAKTVFDPNMNGSQIGDVSIKPIDPLNFFPDPSAKEVQECNYITLVEKYSALTLKAKYPEMIDEIDKLIKKKTAEGNKGSSLFDNDNKKASGPVITLQTDVQATQVYANEGLSNFDHLSESITVYECYLKDDTTFIPKKDDSDGDKQMKAEIGFKYPNGRVIVYAGEDLIFEDKPIDEPTSFPFKKVNLIATNDFWGQGDVEDLMYIQDRINIAYSRLRTLIAKYVSLIVTERGNGFLNDNELVNKFIIEMEIGAMQRAMPQVLTNNTLAEIQNLLEYIRELKKDAKDLARVNDMLLSGQNPAGVKSAKMVETLNESPLTSITSMQNRLNGFFIDISNQAIKLMQLYYNTPRFLRVAEGKEYVQLGLKDAEGNPYIDRHKADVTGDLENDIKQIKGDLSIAEYEVEVVAGSQIPRTKESEANLMMELYKEGLLGDQSDIDVKNMLLESLDVKNRRAIIQMQKDKAEENAKNPAPIPPIPEIKTSFKDLPIKTQDAILQKADLPGHSMMDFVPDLIDASKAADDSQHKGEDREQSKQLAQFSKLDKTT